MTESLRKAPWGEAATRILAAALEAVEPRAAVRRHLLREGETLWIGGRRYALDQYERILVVGAGKAGTPMTQAVVEILGERVSGGLVIVKEGHAGGARHVGPVAIHEASHPLPDGRGVAATAGMLEELGTTNERDLVICLISGGGSALLTAPVEGLTLEALRGVTNHLLKQGGDIHEVNSVRKTLDRVKGGGLARAAAPAEVLTLILSDVVGDPLDVIASGPTVPNPSSVQEALAVVEKYALDEQLPAGVFGRLQQRARKEESEATLPEVDAFRRVRNVLVGNNEMATKAALTQAGREGFNTHLITTRMQGEAREVGGIYALIFQQLRHKGEPAALPACLVAGGETTVTVRGEGLGGRNQELALAAIEGMAGLKDVALISLATDGGDGPTDAAGAVVTGETLQRAEAAGMDPAEYLARNDAYHFFEPLGDLLKTGPTQTNVNDLVVLLAS